MEDAEYVDVGAEVSLPGTKKAQQEGQWHFLVGTALSVYQNAGGINTNWSNFEQTKNWLGQPVIEGGDQCGDGNGFWDNFEEDIERSAGLNSNCFRFSLEWGRIEPSKGSIDQAAVKRYHAILDCLARHKLEPVVTLHHFVHPQWFEDLGGFTKEENISHFVCFAEFAFREFGEKIVMWTTFNEPAVMGFCGWLYGAFPPARMVQFHMAGLHLLNTYRAHAAVYKAIKALPGGARTKIGLVHNFLRYEPLLPKAVSAIYLQPLCEALEHVWATGLTIDFFRTGHFKWDSPWPHQSIEWQAEKLPGLDWIGLNYYGRVVIDWTTARVCRPGEVMTDMPFPLYAPGLYEGIVTLSELDVPIYITETGVADAVGDRRRVFLDTYLPEVERAVKDGYDVRGFMYWTLIDNFEWAHGYHKQFGLYKWSPGDGKERTMREETPRLASKFKEWREHMSEWHASAPTPPRLASLGTAPSHSHRHSVFEAAVEAVAAEAIPLLQRPDYP
eukprot:jgi/Botrbrau1/5312/Bobra.0391s0024.1